MFRVGAYESAFAPLSAEDYPVGAEVPVYVLPGGARPVAEPYDASYAALPALVLWGLAAVLAYRAAADYRAPRAALSLAVRAVPADEDDALLGPVPGGPALLRVGVPLTGEGLLVATGDLVPGGWVSLSAAGEQVGAGWAWRPSGLAAAARRKVSLRRGA